MTIETGSNIEPTKYFLLFGGVFVQQCILIKVQARLVCHMMPVSLDCSFVIDPSVFSNGYLYCFQ
jgi:hypothetical protein